MFICMQKIKFKLVYMLTNANNEIFKTYEILKTFMGLYVGILKNMKY